MQPEQLFGEMSGPDEFFSSDFGSAAFPNPGPMQIAAGIDWNDDAIYVTPERRTFDAGAEQDVQPKHDPLDTFLFPDEDLLEGEWQTDAILDKRIEYVRSFRRWISTQNDRKFVCSIRTVRTTLLIMRSSGAAKTRQTRFGTRRAALVDCAHCFLALGKFLDLLESFGLYRKAERIQRSARTPWPYALSALGPSGCYSRHSARPQS